MADGCQVEWHYNNRMYWEARNPVFLRVAKLARVTVITDQRIGAFVRGAANNKRYSGMNLCRFSTPMAVWRIFCESVLVWDSEL